MRAVVFDKYGGPEELYLADVPRPAPAPGQILVKVEAAAVNPADGKWRSGSLSPFWELEFPHVLGHEVAGTVVALGEGGSDFALGDRVVTLFEKQTHGGYAEFAAGDSHATALIPDGMAMDMASAIPVAGLTAAQMIEEILVPQPGHVLLVTGATGAVGRFLVLIAKARGCHVVAAVRLERAKEAHDLGADEVIAVDQPVPEGMVFDHVADTVGGPLVAELCRSLRPGGRICTAATDPIDPTGLPTEPVFVVLHQDGERLRELIAQVDAARFPVPIAHRLPLEEAARAQEMVEAGGLAGKVVLVP